MNMIRRRINELEGGPVGRYYGQGNAMKPQNENYQPGYPNHQSYDDIYSSPNMGSGYSNYFPQRSSSSYNPSREYSSSYNDLYQRPSGYPYSSTNTSSSSWGMSPEWGNSSYNDYSSHSYPSASIYSPTYYRPSCFDSYGSRGTSYPLSYSSAYEGEYYPPYSYHSHPSRRQEMAHPLRTLATKADDIDGRRDGRILGMGPGNGGRGVGGGYDETYPDGAPAASSNAYGYPASSQQYNTIPPHESKMDKIKHPLRSGSKAGSYRS